MGTYSKEGVGIVQQGYEEDYFDFSGGDYIGMADLIEEASGEASPRSDVMSAFEYAKVLDTSNFWAPLRDAYRRESGRQYPPVYRIRFTVEAEALSDAETAAWWQAKKQRENA